MNLVISVNGEELPCSPTMGAILRFEQETGKEVYEINTRSMSEICKYLYCCVASACDRDKKEFNLSFMEFADRVSIEDMAAWQNSVTLEISSEDAEEGPDEKKAFRHQRPLRYGGRLHRHES